jgi:hypothetical protein
MTHLRSLVMLRTIAAVVLFSSCFGTVGVYSDYDDGYPPAGYIATATPVYYQGYPSYYYGGRWYWREGSAWRIYRDEPVYLRDYRTRVTVPIPRQSYGRGHYYGPTFHGAVPARPPPPPPHGAVPVRR